MKHETTTLLTKKALAAALKEMMTRKPLSKITISDIVSTVGLNRKTFYYHFADVTALLQWVLEQEAVEVVKGFDLIHNFEEATLFVMDYVERNQHIICCAYDSIGREGMKSFLYSDFTDIVSSAISLAEQEVGVRVPEDFKEFLVQFYAEAVAGTLINWFQARNRRPKEAVARDIMIIFRHAIPNILKAKAEEGI